VDSDIRKRYEERAAIKKEEELKENFNRLLFGLIEEFLKQLPEESLEEELLNKKKDADDKERKEVEDKEKEKEDNKKEKDGEKEIERKDDKKYDDENEKKDKDDCDENITELFDNELLKIDVNTEEGFVETIGDGVIKSSGLDSISFGELVFLPEVNIFGFACNLNQNTVDILILGDDRYVSVGMVILSTNTPVRIPVTTSLLGRVINPLGEIIDGDLKLEEINNQLTANINVKAPGIMYREKVSEPMFTGIKIIDSLIPIGRGQRELIIGDKGTGKTSICFDTILIQKKENFQNIEESIYCIYVAIGQKRSSVKSLVDNLKMFNALDYSIIVSATSSDSAALQYLAPYSGCALAEFFMTFAHALIVYDDLSQHAVAYRQISLLLRRPPGREAYPGDVFYLHSRLLERAAKLNISYGGGSLTALPVIETLFGDVTAYIPTNVISITDGQIFLDKNLFTEGIVPAINIGLSVSRVGSAAQVLAMKKVAGSLKLELAQYREVKDFVKFGSDLSDDTISLINRGRLLTQLLKQKRFFPVSIEEQILMLYAGLNSFLDRLSLSKLEHFTKEMLIFIKMNIITVLHFSLFRYSEYFKIFSTSAMEIFFFYFGNYVYK